MKENPSGWELTGRHAGKDFLSPHLKWKTELLAGQILCALPGKVYYF